MSGVEMSGVELSGVEMLGVELSGVEMSISPPVLGMSLRLPKTSTRKP